MTASRIQGPKRILDLSLDLFIRTIGAKYRKSVLGYFWFAAPALLVAGGATLAARAGAINLQSFGSMPVFLSVLIAVVLWQIFAESLEVPARAVEGARSFITRVQVPPEAVVFAQLAETAIGALLRFAMLVIFALVFGGNLGGLPAIFTAILVAALLGTGIGCLLTPVMLLFADARDVLRYIAAYGIFATSAFYSPTQGVFGAVVAWNPLTLLMDIARAALVAPDPGQALMLLAWLGVAGVLTVAGVLLLRISIPIVVERMLMGGR